MLWINSLTKNIQKYYGAVHKLQNKRVEEGICLCANAEYNEEGTVTGVNLYSDRGQLVQCVW
jgi:hypothetical protein